VKRILYSGFTMIELLIVIAIIGILSTIVVMTYSNDQASARDAERKSDLEQYRNALEAYANGANGIYPVDSSVPGVAADSICGASGLNLTTTCPVDPKSGTGSYGYKYLSNAGGTKYVLYAYLERTSTYFGLCSDGVSISLPTYAPTIANCP